MSNHITIELCEADRARQDRIICLLAELIDRLPAHVSISTPPTSGMIRIAEGDDTRESDDEIQQKLRKIVKKGTEAPQEATEAAAPTVATPEEETPTAAEKEPAPTVTLEQIQQKVVQLCAVDAGKKKAMVREIINLYGTKVSDLKDRPDKWDEVWGLLTALEKEAIA